MVLFWFRFIRIPFFFTTIRNNSGLFLQDGSNPPGTPRASYPIPEMPRRGRKPGWRKANSINGGGIVPGHAHPHHHHHHGGLGAGQQTPTSLQDEILHKLRQDKEDHHGGIGSAGGGGGGPLPSFTSSAAAVVAELAIQSLAAAAAAAAAAGQHDSPDQADLNSPAGGSGGAGTAVNYHNSPGPMTPEPQAMALNLAASRSQNNNYAVPAESGSYPPASPSPWQQGQPQQQQQQHFEDNYPSLARPQAARATPGPQQTQQQQTPFYPERPSSCYSFDGAQQQGGPYNGGGQLQLQPPATPGVHSYNGSKLPPASPNPSAGQQQDPSRCGTPSAAPPEASQFARFAAAAAAVAAAASSSSRCPPGSPGSTAPSSSSSSAGTTTGSITTSSSSSSNPYPSPAPSPGYASVTSRVFSGSYGLQNWGNVNMQGLSGYSQTYPLPPHSPYPRNPYGGYY